MRPWLLALAGLYELHGCCLDRVPPVRCAPVELKPGQVTTVRVQRFHI